MQMRRMAPAPRTVALYVVFNLRVIEAVGADAGISTA